MNEATLELAAPVLPIQRFPHRLRCLCAAAHPALPARWRAPVRAVTIAAPATPCAPARLTMTDATTSDTPDDEALSADHAALTALCDRLGGFGVDISPEFIDGYLAALVVGPVLVMPSQWVAELFDDDLPRVFADPQDMQQAMSVLMGYWNTLTQDLSPDKIADQPDQMHWAPLMMSWDDAARAQVVATGELSEQQANDQFQTGGLWAAGFMEAVHEHATQWKAPRDEDQQTLLIQLLKQVDALHMSQADLAHHLREFYDADTQLTRDQLIDEACFAVQVLRLYWQAIAPSHGPIRAAAKPGRNDPCHCGSGKKYKKCHGAN